MKKFNKIRLFVILFIILSANLVALAQSIRLEAKTIKYAKTYPVSGIEKGLPTEPFLVWFQKLVGIKTPIIWEINDCGEQTGTSADRGRDFPMCVQAIAKPSADIDVSVNIQYGTFKRGITPDQPAVRYISIGKDTGDDYIENLVQLRQRFIRGQQKTDSFDPNGGEFQITGVVPKGFEKFRKILLATMDYDNAGNIVAVNPFGSVIDNSYEFVMQNMIFDGKILTFETTESGNMSFKFDGKFSKITADSRDLANGKNALSGHLTKFVKGKKRAEVDLTFSFVNYSN